MKRKYHSGMTCHGPPVKVRKAYKGLCKKSNELFSPLLEGFAENINDPDIDSWPYLQCCRLSCNYPIKKGKHPNDFKCSDSECHGHVSVQHFPYQSDEARKMDIQRKVKVILTFRKDMKLKGKLRFVSYANIVVRYLTKQLKKKFKEDSLD